jgi:peptidoglycan/LPS O-acetylase OafA/YrhL
MCSTHNQISIMSKEKHSDIEACADFKQHPPEPVRSTQYVHGLRGIAALIVYLSHTVPWWYGIDHPIQHGFGYRGEFMLATLPFLRTFFTGGAAAVALFFVMSGYVLSMAPLKMLHNGETTKARWYLLAAAIRRPFRLFLPVAAISLIFALSMHLPLGLAPHLSWPEPQPSLLQELWNWVTEMGWTVNIFVEHGQFSHWFPYDPPAWTMAAELKGSILVFFFLALGARFTPYVRLVSSAAIGVMLLLVYQWELAAFMFGMAIAILDLQSRHKDTRATIVLSHALFAAGWYILGQPGGVKEPELSYGSPGWYYLTMMTPPNYFNNEFWRFWNVIGASMVFLALTRMIWLQQALEQPKLRLLGRVSFCLYLIHIPIAWTIADRICRIFGGIRQDFTTPFDNWLKIPDVGPTGFSSGLLLWQAIVLPLNLWLAALATRWIDVPSAKFGTWLTGHGR